MEKNNRGFTLLELMIAIAVLSVMAAMLFQIFILSGGIDRKSRREERLQEIAKQTMEALKGDSFAVFFQETWEAKEGDGADRGTAVIGEISYAFEPLPSGTGYLLNFEYGGDVASSSSSGKFPQYMIEAKIDWGIYSEVAEENHKDSPYSINRYRMPNIVDVSSFQNVVLDPNTLMQQDALRMGELLLKVNPREGSALDGEEQASGEEAPVYTEENITRFLHVDLSEKIEEGDSESGKMVVRVNAIYTVDPNVRLQPPDQVSDFDRLDVSERTVITPLTSIKRKIIRDETTNKTMNRIYLFLPEPSAHGGQIFEKLYVTSDTKETYELYVVAAADGLTKAGYISVEEKAQAASGKESRVELYTNLQDEGNKQDEPISYHEAERRLYHLSVSIYEADYEGAGMGTAPVKGKKVLQLDSTKSK